ncbi:hypothetical protein CsSME_00017872 [Camellia sinensis var. sinensis]
MADDASHDEGSLRMERELDVIPLLPRAHVLPPGTVRHFTGFARRAPVDLLLREPESHLSYDATKVDSRFTRGYGSTTTREWCMDLPDDVRQIIDKAGFGLFCMGPSRLMASRTLLGALVERWWDTTNSFRFSTTGDMTMTPYDFTMLKGLEVEGQPIPYDSDMDEWEAAWTYLLGAHPPIFRSGMSCGCMPISQLLPLSRRSRRRSRYRTRIDMTIGVTWKPWASMPGFARFHFAGAWGASWGTTRLTSKHT